MSIVILLPLFLLMYFMMIRPNQKAKLAQAEMMRNLAVGDQVAGPDGVVHRRDLRQAELRAGDLPALQVADQAVAGPADRLELGRDVGDLPAHALMADRAGDERTAR